MHDETPDTLPPSDGDPDAIRHREAGAEAGQSLGPYLLRERIGVGGMGEVWKAEQFTPIRRMVALKLIKAGMDSREVMVRFEAERQALAMMDHPFIAKVFDAGTTPLGRPYFAMEYVKGLPISEYCDKRRLSTGDRLRLFQRVCQGVQHAHQKSVLHRDLKPSNVLVADVDGEPRPKIIDFGVAKATTRKLTENTMYTSIGQLIGTPEYMSPEQAEYSNEDVDTRTDVYSLGVILYELLVGALPFPSEELRKAGLEGVFRILREQDPPRPSTKLSSLGERTTKIATRRRTEPRRLTGRLRGDLDWIVLRAIEKDRNRRYGSPSEFAQDIERHLNDEPVLATPPTARYRVTKFVRRHRTGVVIATVGVLALAAFAVTSTLQARTIARERDRAEAAAAKAAAMNEFLASTLATADPWAGGHRDATIFQALNVAVDEIDTAFEGQPELEASMRTVLGQTYLGLGKLEAATTQIERAVEMRSELGVENQTEFGNLLLIEAKLRQNSAQYEAAMDLAARAAGVFREDPNSGPNELVNAYQHQTRNLLYTQRYAEAESVLVLSERLAPGLDGDQRILAAENFSQRADLYKGRDGDDAAADSLSLLAFQKAKSIDPDHAVVSTYLNNTAQYHSQSGDLEGALELFDQALALYEKSFGTDHPQYAICLENRGGVLYQLGRADETLTALETVHDIRSRNLGTDHVDVIRTGLNMGTVAMITGDSEKALSVFRDLKPRLIEARGPDHPDVQVVLRNEGTALRNLDRLDEAMVVLRQALDLTERTNGDEHPRTATARADLGVVLIKAKRFPEAEPLMLAAFDRHLADTGASHPRTKTVAEWLVKMYEETGNQSGLERFRPYLEE